MRNNEIGPLPLAASEPSSFGLGSHHESLGGGGF